MFSLPGQAMYCFNTDTTASRLQPIHWSCCTGGFRITSFLNDKGYWEWFIWKCFLGMYFFFWTCVTTFQHSGKKSYKMNQNSNAEEYVFKFCNFSFKRKGKYFGCEVSIKHFSGILFFYKCEFKLVKFAIHKQVSSFYPGITDILIVASPTFLLLNRRSVS